VAYALSPIDLIPDFIPVIGMLDDVILLLGLIAVVVELIPADILSQCRVEAMSLWIPLFFSIQIDPENQFQRSSSSHQRTRTTYPVLSSI
jgi:uncharacterized membrane protein YkvA (DUF1232 family)